RTQSRIERTEWLMMGCVLLFLLGVGLFFVPNDVWARGAAGLVSPPLGQPALPVQIDWVLITAVAAGSGAGGAINPRRERWPRGGGFGMAGTIGFTPTSIGGTRVPLALEGTIFPPTASNLAKWREWWYYLRADLWFLWTPGCLVAMALPVLLAVAFVASGTD